MIDFPLIVFLTLLALMFGIAVRFGIQRRRRFPQSRRETAWAPEARLDRSSR